MYNASKAGVHMLTKSLASEYATSGIRVNCVGDFWMPQRVAELSRSLPIPRRDLATGARVLYSGDFHKLHLGNHVPDNEQIGRGGDDADNCSHHQRHDKGAGRLNDEASNRRRQCASEVATEILHRTNRCRAIGRHGDRTQRPRARAGDVDKKQ